MGRKPLPVQGKESAGVLRTALENVSTPLSFFVMVVVVLAGGCFGVGSVIHNNNGWILYCGGFIIILVIVLVVSYLIINNRSWELYGRGPLEEALAQNLAVTIFESIDWHLGNLPDDEEQIETLAEIAVAMKVGLSGEQDKVKEFRAHLSRCFLGRLKQRNRTRSASVEERVVQLVEERRAAID